MVKEGIVFGHHISEKGIEVDRAKVKVIERLPPPISVKGVRGFLGMQVFTRDSSKIFQKLHIRCANCSRKILNFVLMNHVLKNSLS